MQEVHYDETGSSVTGTYVCSVDNAEQRIRKMLRWERKEPMTEPKFNQVMLSKFPPSDYLVETRRGLIFNYVVRTQANTKVRILVPENDEVVVKVTAGSSTEGNLENAIHNLIYGTLSSNGLAPEESRYDQILRF